MTRNDWLLFLFNTLPRISGERQVSAQKLLLRYARNWTQRCPYLDYEASQNRIAAERNENVLDKSGRRLIEVLRRHFSGVAEEKRYLPLRLACVPFDIRTQTYPRTLPLDQPVRFQACNNLLGRSQWPRGLRHELSSLARTLRSWVRIPFKAWMSVSCEFILFLLLCV
jgi:hypothetical protein